MPKLATDNLKTVVVRYNAVELGCVLVSVNNGSVSDYRQYLPKRKRYDLHVNKTNKPKKINHNQSDFQLITPGLLECLSMQYHQQPNQNKNVL